jgi:hypothetical protein
MHADNTVCAVEIILVPFGCSKGLSMATPVKLPLNIRDYFGLYLQINNERVYLFES